MMLTLRQLLSATNGHRDKLFKNASKVAVMFNSNNEAIMDQRGYYLDVSGKAITQMAGKRPHKFQIRLYYAPRNYIPPGFRKPDKIYKGPDKPKPFTLETKVWVSCTCEYFMYHCEVANAEKDNSSILWSNGKAPNITNPFHVPHLCKHLIQASKKGLLRKKEKLPPAKAAKAARNAKASKQVKE